jgi:hypothetical protein
MEITGVNHSSRPGILLELRSRDFERIWNVRTRYIPVPEKPTKGLLFGTSGI